MKTFNFILLLSALAMILAPGAVAEIEYKEVKGFFIKPSLAIQFLDYYRDEELWYDDDIGLAFGLRSEFGFVFSSKFSLGTKIGYIYHGYDNHGIDISHSMIPILLSFDFVGSGYYQFGFYVGMAAGMNFHDLRGNSHGNHFSGTDWVFGAEAFGGVRVGDEIMCFFMEIGYNTFGNPKIEDEQFALDYENDLDKDVGGFELQLGMVIFPKQWK